jgi:limonene-1,2-epoxide hydrolase
MGLRKITFLITTLCFTITVNAQKKQSFSDVTANTKEVTTTYFNDYISLNFEAMKKQASDDISFDDTTAKLIFGVELIKGKKKVFENFKNTYAVIVEMKSDIKRTIFSSNVGIFEIELTYKFEATPDKIITITKMPLIVCLTVKDGKIIEHRDYGDYNHFLEQYKIQNN